MEQEQSIVEKFEKFTWKVENFSKYDSYYDVYSEPFVLGGYPWMIMFNQRGDEYDEGDLSVYLGAAVTSNISEGWSRLVKFRLFVLNQIDSKRSIIGGFQEQEFNENSSVLGWECIVTSYDLDDPHSGFVVNDTCIIGAEVSFCKSKNEKQVNEASGLTTPVTFGSRILQIEAETLRPKLEGHGQNLGELMDFKGLGQIEKDLVPFLEEVCSQHPSLIECQQKRSRKFREWAFTALGRVLHFLKTMKVKDMNDLACKDLQNFWEELEPFSFDLTWLEPHVQSALGMKSYLEKVKKVEKLKDNAVALELEIMRLKTKVVTLEANLDAVRDLLKAEDFEERDLDAALGFVKP